MPIITATVKSFDEATHTADIVPQAYPSGVWESVPIAEDVDGELMTVDAVVAVQTWDDGRALILGPFGGRPTPPISDRNAPGNLSASVITTWTAFASFTLTLTVASHIWAQFNTYLQMPTQATTIIKFAVKLRVGAADQLPIAILPLTLSQEFNTLSLSTRTPSAKAPGAYVIDAQYYVYSAGAVALTGPVLTAWAWPA